MVCQPVEFCGAEVREQLHFPKQVKFHDITLRDGEQQTGVIFTKDDKIRIAEGLAEAGVHRIEAGMPVVSPADTAAIKEIVKRNLGPQIFAFSRCMVDDVKRAVDCGVSGIVMEVPSSTHIIEYAYKWPLEKAIDLSIESTAYAHSQGLEVVFFPIDFSRAEINWVLDLITTRRQRRPHGRAGAGGYVRRAGSACHAVPGARSQEAHQQAAGSAFPHGFRHGHREHHHGGGRRRRGDPFDGAGPRRARRQRADGRDGDGAADAVRRRSRASSYDKLYGLAQLVEKLSGHKVASNRPVVGEQLFQIESRHHRKLVA